MVKLLECSITKQSDHKLLKFVSNCIKQDNDDSFDHNITGDCNLPAINWETATLKSDGFSEMLKSCRALLSFMSEHFLSQYVRCPTRGNNVLDIFLTNNDRLISVLRRQNYREKKRKKRSQPDRYHVCMESAYYQLFQNLMRTPSDH